MVRIKSHNNSPTIEVDRTFYENVAQVVLRGNNCGVNLDPNDIAVQRHENDFNTIEKKCLFSGESEESQI